MQEETPFSKFLSSCEQHRLPPRPFGIVQRNRDRKEINLNDITIGDAYAQALADGLEQYDSPVKMNLKSNHLSDKGVVPILQALKSDLVELDISYNPRIGAKGYDVLCDAIDVRLPHLKLFSMEGNQAGDEVIKKLLEVLQVNISVTFLNISDNKISDRVGKDLASLLRYNNNINCIFMRWNNIKAKGAQHLVRQLTDNDSLQILDASFNSFGS